MHTLLKGPALPPILGAMMLNAPARLRSARHGEMATWAARLYAVSGVLAFVCLLAPAEGERTVPVIAMLGIVDLALAALIAKLPAAWWSERRIVAVAVASLAMVALFAVSGAVPAFGYPTFYIVLFAWIGLALPQGWGMRLALPAAVAYVVPSIVRGGPVELTLSVVVAVPVMVLIAEVCSAVVARLDQLAATLAHTASRDELTGVGNRRRADELVRDLAPGDAVIMIDVDHFKEVNDLHGHAAGDHVLTELGALLRRVVRDADLIARYGGEEFVVVARDAAGEARAVAERIADAWRGLPSTLPTLSLGVAVHDGAQSAAETLHRADRAVYQAKRSGRDQVCLSQRG